MNVSDIRPGQMVFDRWYPLAPQEVIRVSATRVYLWGYEPFSFGRPYAPPGKTITRYDRAHARKFLEPFYNEEEPLMPRAPARLYPFKVGTHPLEGLRILMVRTGAGGRWTRWTGRRPLRPGQWARTCAPQNVPILQLWGEDVCPSGCRDVEVERVLEHAIFARL